MMCLKVSLLIQVVLATYFQTTIWLPLGSWNNQPGKRLIELIHDGQSTAALGFALVMLFPVLLYALAFWKRWFWLMWLGLFGCGAWAFFQIQSWWIPWIFGPDERALHNQRFLEKTFKVLPESPNHPAPDAMHFVLDCLLFASVVTLAIGLRKARHELRLEIS